MRRTDVRCRTGIGPMGGPAHALAAATVAQGGWLQPGIDTAEVARNTVCDTTGAASGDACVGWPTTQQRAGTPVGAHAWLTARTTGGQQA